MKFAALAKLEIELDQAEGGGDRAKAYLAVLDMLSKMGKHSEVLRRGEEFLTIKAMVSKSPAKLLMAGALENLGKVDDAIAQYEQLAERDMGFISVSVPASRGGAELRWERNLPSTGGNPSDRQIAYENLQRFLKMTERIYPKFTAGEKVAWDNLKLSMQSYEEHEDTLPLPR